VAEQKSGEVVGVVAVTKTALQGIALLYSIFVIQCVGTGSAECFSGRP